MRSKWKLNLPLLGQDLSTGNISNPCSVSLGKDFLNTRVDVYDGKKYISMVVKDYMLHQRLSKYVISKYTGKNIHIKRKKRKNKK